MSFKQRKFRQKASIADDDEEEEQPTIIAKPSANAARPGASKALPPVAPHDTRLPKKDSKPSLLSFAEDVDHADDDALRKSKSKDRKGKMPRAPGMAFDGAQDSTATQRSGAGEYTAERMAELRQNAISISTASLARPASQEELAGQDAEPIFKLSGSFKRGGAAQEERISVAPAHSTAVTDAEEAALLPPPPRIAATGSAAEGAAAAGASAGSKGQQAAVAEDEEEDGLDIPNAETIRLAKLKRERMRQSHYAPDYVPITGAMGRLRTGDLRSGAAGGGAAEGEGVHSGSASDEGDEPDRDMRIKFTADAAKRDLSAYEQSIGTHTAGTSGAEPEEQEDAFEQEQLRKAIRRQQSQMASTSGAAASRQAGPGYAGMGGSAGSRAAAVAAAGESVLATLQAALKRANESHKHTKQTLQRTTDNLTTSLAKIEQFEQAKKQSGDRYLYVQSLRAWVADLVECLAVKSAIIEELEEARLELVEEQAASGRGSAAALEQELLDCAGAAVQAALVAIAQGKSIAVAADAAAAAVDKAEEALDDRADSMPVQLDEFGRNTNLRAKREVELRAKQRQGIVKAEQALLESVARGAPIPVTDTDSPEGDASEASSHAHFAKRYSEIMEAAAAAFADAADEFATLAAVKKQLEEWKAKFPQDYAQTYMHLSTPALFAPYVRLQLLSWDPFMQAPGSHAAFDKQDWYEQLFDYGMNAQDEAAQALLTEDPDQELVPQLVRKLVLPQALRWVARAWDARSARQGAAVAALASDLLVYIPPEDEKLTELLATIRGALERAVDESSVPPWPPAAVAATPLGAAVLLRRFRRAAALVHTLSAYEGLLSRPLLIDLAVSKLLCGQMLPYCRAAATDVSLAVARVEAATSGLCMQWFAGGPGSVPQVAPLLELCAGLGRSLEAQRTDSSKAQLAVRLAKVLVRLGESERGHWLAAAFKQKLQ